MNDTIIQTADTIQHSLEAMDVSLSNTNFWQIVAIVFMALCLLELIYILHLKMQRNTLPKSIDKMRMQLEKDGAVDFGNIINSAFLSTSLYNKLKVQCHPDRFIDDPLRQEIANDIFQRITQNKVNYNVLQALEKEAQEKLNI